MSSDRKVHVLGLLPKQQAALRLLLYNLFCGFTAKMLEDVTDLKTGESLITKKAVMVKSFDRYQNLIDLLAKRDVAHASKAKVLTLDPSVMANLVAAVNCFEEGNTYLEANDVDYVKSELKILSEKILESERHLYTAAEVRQARNDI